MLLGALAVTCFRGCRTAPVGDHLQLVGRLRFAVTRSGRANGNE
jgi:hypothetical protein